MRSSLVALTVAAAVLATSPLHAQQRRNWGAQWKAFGSQNHALYVGGLQEGYIGIPVLVGVLVGELPAEGAVEDDNVRALNLTDEQKTLLKAIAEARFKDYEIELFGVEAVSRVVDDLYSDPSNTFIQWDEMVRVSVLRLRGEPDDRIQQRLAILRAVSAGRD